MRLENVTCNPRVPLFKPHCTGSESSKNLNEIHAWSDRKVGGNNMEDMFYSLDSLSRGREKKKDSAEQCKRTKKGRKRKRKAGGTGGEKRKKESKQH